MKRILNSIKKPRLKHFILGLFAELESNPGLPYGVNMELYYIKISFTFHKYSIMHILIDVNAAPM